MTIVQGSVKDKPCCDEHYSPAHWVLEIGKQQIPLCPKCVKDLKNALDDCKEFSNHVERKL